VTTQAWGILLTIAALVAIVLQFRRWRAGRVTTLQLVAGFVARLGFVLLGVIYSTGLAQRWTRAPLYGLGIVGIGIVLNLTAGVIESVRAGR
jgi:hypothetical protein